VSVDLPEGSSRFGGSLAMEKTFIEDRLELELGISGVIGGGESELSVSLLFKKPWQLSSKVELMIGVGPELPHSLENHGETAPGVVARLDFTFRPRKNVGWFLEPGYELVFHREARVRRDGRPSHWLVRTRLAAPMLLRALRARSPGDASRPPAFWQT